MMYLTPSALADLGHVLDPDLCRGLFREEFRHFLFGDRATQAQIGALVEGRTHVGEQVLHQTLQAFCRKRRSFPPAASP